MIVYERSPHYYETDQMKIVHHSNYIRWFEEARVAYLDAIGMSFAEQEKKGIVSPVLTVDAKYIRMVRFGDTVEITTRVNLYNGLRWGFSYEVRDKATGELCCTGTSTHCFLDEKGAIIRAKRDYTAMDAVLTRCLAEDAK